MSSNADRLSRLEAALILLAGAGLFLWYANPQIFFTFRPAYELGRLILLVIWRAPIGA